MKKKLTLSFLVFIGVLVALFFGIKQKAYPVATANDAFVSARSFQLAVTAGTSYYRQVGEVYDGPPASTDGELILQIRRAAMQALIEDRLIATELEKTYGVQQLAAAVDGEVSAALAGSTQTTPQAITQLFGLSVEEFSEVILAPQARIELLQAELAKSNIDFDAWLTSALLKARVSIVVRDLGWRAGSVELTGVQSYTAEVKGIISQIASTTEAIQAAVSATTTVASSSASSTQ